MNRNDLVLALANTTGMKVKEADDAVVRTLHEILVFISQHEGLSLMGFGSFRVKKKAARTGRNPRTGENIVIPEKFTISFRPGKVMKDMVNIQSAPDKSDGASARTSGPLSRFPRTTRKKNPKTDS
jgi:nucleoid DNA-binding protein